MTTTLLPTVEIEPRLKACATVIFLHGLGADGHDFEPIVPHLKLPDELAVRFVFPHAPRRPVTLNQGYVMPAWFDIGSDDLMRGESSDIAGLKCAEEQVRALIDREVARGIETQNIVVGGFSQGGALASWVALRHPKPLAGLIALSTFLAKNAPVEAEASPANRSIAAFGAHGTRDGVVGIAYGRTLMERLRKIGCDVEWHEYPMAHEVCMEEIAHWGAWLRARFE
ncbi:MAG: alpha/beta fold hydrolase [Planctomycetota bacterium]|nr:alpha/beta fold hydrolase [Planctomycetota bacterium]